MLLFSTLWPYCRSLVRWAITFVKASLCLSWLVFPSCLLRESCVAQGLWAVPSVLGGARQKVRIKLWVKSNCFLSSKVYDLFLCIPGVHASQDPCIIWESASRAGGGTKMRSATKAGRPYFLPQIWNVAQSLAFQTWSYEDCLRQ